MSRQTDIKKLIVIYNRRLQKLREKEAFYGINTAPEIVLEIEQIEEKLKLLHGILAQNSAPEAISSVDIANELARLTAEEQTPTQGLNVNIRGVSNSAIHLGNIVTGSVKGDVVGGNKIINGDEDFQPDHDQEHLSE